MFYKLYLFLLCLVFTSCAKIDILHVQSQNWSQDKIDSYCKNEFVLKDSSILNISSTSASYYVFKALDLNTNTAKEICSEYNFLRGAIDRDQEYYYDEKNRIHHFRNKESLDNIGFYQFNVDQLEKCRKSYDLKEFIQSFEKDHILFANFIADECQIYFAHLLFKDGVMSKRGSLVGSLIIMTDSQLELEEKQMQKIIGKHNSEM